MDMQSTDMVGTRTELGHALDSWAIRATAYLRADTKAPLLVYVEDREDIPFWRELFQCISEKYSEINITTLKEIAASSKPEVNCDGDVLRATGKDALMCVQGLGTNKVVAVDRDLDGLIDDYHTYTDRVRNDKYVISTTYYAIENHIVSLAAINVYLNRIIGAASGYAADYQFALARFNQLLDPILLLSLVCIEHRVLHGGRIPYTMKNLASDIAGMNNKHDEQTMLDCCRKIKLHRRTLLATKASDIQKMKTRLVASLKYPDALWKIVKGHTLYAFVYSYMYQIVKKIYDTKESAIYSQYGHGEEADAKIKELQEQMFSSYRDLRTCVYYYAYDNPTIDYNDTGIVKILEKIKNIS